MNVLFGNIARIDEYKMTAQSSAKLSFKECIGRTVRIEKACSYETITREGNNKTILSIMTDEGIVISGDSKTTMDSFSEILNVFGEEMNTLDVTIVGAESKNGRTFITLQVL